MPLYNGGDYVLSSIESVRQQTFESWELIVVDDASVDQSRKIVSALSLVDTRIRMILLDKNGGPAVARNAGLDAAKGRFIAFLDCDDLWVPEKLARQLSAMVRKGEAISFTAMFRADEKLEKVVSRGVPPRVSYFDMLKTNYIGCSSAMYDSEVLGKVRAPLLRRRQDYGLWLLLLKKTQYAYGINEPLVIYRVRSGSVSSNKITTAFYTWRLYRRVEGLAFLFSLWCISNQLIRALIRNRMPSVAKKLGILYPVSEVA